MVQGDDDSGFALLSGRLDHGVIRILANEEGLSLTDGVTSRLGVVSIETMPGAGISTVQGNQPTEQQRLWTNDGPVMQPAILRG
jgi:hypothetical protein